MMNRKGFTLIELLIVVVIIGILAAIAIPKFAATKDKAKLASIKSDIRNIETAEEAYFADNAAYGVYSAINGANLFTSSTGNVATITLVGTTGYTVSVTNSSITSGNNTCTVTVGGTASTDGEITCS
ncbi:MAG TPA: prepilin-type N-terminal cleavage/methylation domain-containing protein [Gemmatimonadales bacterium]|nr:prepilin-type N-terminal cleavage/methylation domain-containing protein [Gemmatimonadales bacterium]